MESPHVTEPPLSRTLRTCSRNRKQNRAGIIMMPAPR